MLICSIGFATARRPSYKARLLDLPIIAGVAAALEALEEMSAEIQTTARALVSDESCSRAPSCIAA
jgi:hypothetical protein